MGFMVQEEEMTEKQHKIINNFYQKSHNAKWAWINLDGQTKNEIINITN